MHPHPLENISNSPFSFAKDTLATLEAGITLGLLYRCFKLACGCGNRNGVSILLNSTTTNTTTTIHKKNVVYLVTMVGNYIVGPEKILSDVISVTVNDLLPSRRVKVLRLYHHTDHDDLHNWKCLEADWPWLNPRVEPCKK